MNENIENNDWMNEAPTLAAMRNGNPFSVPDGYFENCDEAIFSSIFIDGIKQKTKDNSFEVPQNYFEELTERITTHVAISQIAKAENAFAVPENYFDTLQSRIAGKIEASEVKKEAKIIPMWRKSFFKYASAACFLLVASFGLYFYQNSTTAETLPTQSADVYAEQMLYDIDEHTIIEHIESQNVKSSVTNTKSESDTDMENYILNNYSSSDLTQELNN
ncbi:hypothetical protein DHW03_12025 [Pedobacter yonginense]|uniref:Uncharacterized protein n=2 Tax=Pedobacter yonginense TaxID=651869 RepID=A0A317ELI6_9SPHI|nr:hypothetical protein DHW03_12025 [Pedobacter yonginense]